MPGFDRREGIAGAAGTAVALLIRCSWGARFRHRGRCRTCDGQFVTSVRYAISVLDSEDTEQSELRGGQSPWYAPTKQAARLDLNDSQMRCSDRRKRHNSTLAYIATP
jgi:hypothetical protein